LNWILHRLGSRLRFAVRNPAYTARALAREFSRADERALARFTSVPASTIRSFLDEPLQDSAFASRLRAAEAEFVTAEIESASLYAKKVLIQYAAVRAFAPDVVVETGVASGVSTSYLLYALHRNQRGTLYSIELGDPRYLPKGKPPGWIVPSWLRSRWNLRLGDSRKLLPELLSHLGKMDVFIHDSLHSYEHMLWEYRAAYPHLRPGGLLLSDDADWNTAFREFAVEAHATNAPVLRGVGLLQKENREDAGVHSA